MKSIHTKGRLRDRWRIVATWWRFLRGNRTEQKVERQRPRERLKVTVEYLDPKAEDDEHED